MYFGCFLLQLNVFGQIAVENSEAQNVLYRCYSNKLIVGVTGSSYDSLKIDSGTISATTVDGKQELIIVPGGSNSCTLYALKYNKTGIDTIDARVFKVKPLPPPLLFWGTNTDGDKASKSATRLDVRYGPEVFLRAKFDILNWESNINGKVISGKGSELSTEFLNAVKNLESDQLICISVVFKGENEYTRRTSGCWKN
ncbi:MAG: hypothetical protein RIT43_114 [Bacteroidota bacterium]